jgi:hypothetical protein
MEEQLSYRHSQQDETAYQNLLFHVYMKLNMFRATTAHHHELKTALAVSGFAYVKGCWTLWLLDANNVVEELEPV